MPITPLPLVAYYEPYNTVRRAKLMLLDDCLKDYAEYLEMSIIMRQDLNTKIELSCYLTAIEKSNELNAPIEWTNTTFTCLYHSLCNKITSNIDVNGLVKNTRLAQQILDGQIDITELPKLASIELYPEKYETIIARLELSKNVETTVKTSNMYKCRRCHTNKCKIENRYNRSLDEGVNLTITCCSCGFEWNA